MFKRTISSVLARPVRPKANKNELCTNGDGGIGGGMIDNRLINVSSSTKKMSSESAFFTFEASLAFTQLKKTFTKALILHYFDPECHI